MSGKDQSVGDEVQELLLSFPEAVKRVQEAARNSLEVAHAVRTKVRRQRIVTRSSPSLQRIVVAGPPPEPLEMPAEWCDEEITKKISVKE